MHNEIFENWMKQPSQIKKLQGLLALSIIINLFLFMQILPSKKTEKKQVQEIISTKTEDPIKQSKISEVELKEFIANYMNSFFSISDEALSYIKAFSSKSLFENNLDQELQTRREQSITSEFKLDDLVLESLSANQAKAIILGRETFPNRDYENRNFTIELVIDTEKIQVDSIPIFKIN